MYLCRRLCLHGAVCVMLQFCYRITSKMNAEKQLFLACIIVVQPINHAGRYTVAVIQQ